MKTTLILLALLTVGLRVMAADRSPATVLGLTDPVSVAYVDGCPDGGFTKGKLLDVNGKEYHFFIDRRLQTETYGRWYVCADMNTSEADILTDTDGRIGATYAILLAWFNRATTAEERSLQPPVLFDVGLLVTQPGVGKLPSSRSCILAEQISGLGLFRKLQDRSL